VKNQALGLRGIPFGREGHTDFNAIQSLSPRYFSVPWSNQVILIVVAAHILKLVVLQQHRPFPRSILDRLGLFLRPLPMKE
jgi:hypothetical protein